ncbi:hypothetical protein [Flavimaricola marinus]|uniref:Uncharacterized protein n=1 Tax=Flavimaricola marinus TaxID=1819565 RepID=A0A238LI65_9RHOB|nr:hypothetical protein [Flavimaricola marinus]SMY09318.1 hypothetical protein LOM8899_03483 [Flavimaricola marinus]
MKIILFIGHHKVGSSALQSYLAQNAVALLRQGVLYPAVEALGFERLSSGDVDDIEPWLLPPNLREAHNALAFSMIHDHNGSPVPPLHSDLPSTDEMLALIQRQVDLFNPEVMVLAAEVFSHFGNINCNLIKRLTGAFPGAEIQLSATLRRVDDYLISWHGQRLRFGQKVRALPGGALSHYVKTIHFDYRKMLQGWVATLPEAPLTLRTYAEVMAAGGSVKDFMAQAGLPMPAPSGTDRGEERRINAGLHRALIEIARQGNATLSPQDAADMFRVLLQIGPELDLPLSPQIELYGAAARTRLVNQFVPVNDWLVKLVDRPVFADLDQMGHLRDVPEFEANKAALAQLTKSPYAKEFRPAARSFLAGLELAPNYE